MMQIKTFNSNSTDSLVQDIAELKTDGFSPNLAVVFCSVDFDLGAVSSIFNQLDIDIAGASTAGEIVNDSVYDGVITGLLFEINRDYYEVFSAEYESDNPFSACKKIGELAAARFKHPAILAMSGGVSVDAEQIVYGLRAGLSIDAPIFGGLAADDLQLTKTFSFTRHDVYSNGIAVLAFDNDKVELKGLATSGWEGVGMEHSITHAEGNIVYTINNEPAVNAFVKHFGYFDNDNTGEVSEMSAQYPLQILREDGTAILRAPLLQIKENGALVLAGGVKNGDRFRFSIAPGFEVIDQTIAEFADMKAQTNEADGLILFSCKGRHSALGPLIEDEVKGIYDFWKKPMIGFFTYGEIGPTKNGICEFHNETCSLVVINERK
ncbi:MAG: FIST C-terminal domain-containing protein [Saprospiraceae bacterium]|nr:FIST C-terminal domain-containing protein [Saprospiraceae bacterium]